MHKFDIRVLSFDDAPGKDPVADLAGAFGISADMARQVVARAPVLVKRGVDEAQAEQLFHLLTEIGAKVRIEPAADTRQTEGPPPSIPMPSGADAPLGVAPMPALPVPNFDAPGVTDSQRSHRPGAPVGPVPVGDVGSTRPASTASGRPAPGTMRPASGSMRPGAPSSIPAPTGDQWHCPGCNVTFFEHQVRAASNLPSRPGMKRVFVCPRCEQAVRPVTGRRAIPLTNRLLGAFRYPFQKSAPVIFVGVALVASLFELVPIFGPFFMAAVLATFYFSVIRGGAAGNGELPSARETRDFSDFFGPLVRFHVALIAPYIPVVLLAFYMPESSVKGPVLALAALSGLIYMPASVMVGVLNPSCLGPLNPVAGVTIISRVPGSYAVTTLAVAMVLGLDSLVLAAVSAAVEDIPFAGWFLINLAGLPLPTIASRMLGVFLHHHEAELGFE